jgi:hypothetical protein
LYYFKEMSTKPLTPLISQPHKNLPALPPTLVIIPAQISLVLQIFIDKHVPPGDFVSSLQTNPR